MDKQSLEKKLRGYRLTSLKILKELANSPVVVSSNLGNATVYKGEKLGGQLSTLSRENLTQKAGYQRWQLNPEIDREWLKQFLDDLNV